MIWMITTGFLESPATKLECSRTTRDAYAATYGAEVCGALTATFKEVLIFSAK